MFKILSAIVVVYLTFCSSLAQAATVTFDQNLGLCGENPTTIYEYGVNWSDRNRSIYNHCSPTLMVGDDGWRATQNIYADAGRDFDALAFYLSGWVNIDNPTWDFLIVNGYTGGTLTASLSIVAQDITASFSKIFLTGFTNLDRLEFVMNASVYDTVYWGGSAPYNCLDSDKCGRLDIDNLVIANLPIPGAFLLLMTAFAGLGWSARRKV